MLALEGIKALDLSWQGPGPFCTMMLGDLGADVLRIQEPGLSGRRASAAALSAVALEEDTRRIAFSAYNRNKRSLTLNLKTEPGHQIFFQLVKGADVIVEGFRPGVARRLGVNYEAVSQVNPRIVYCSITGYGQTGPYSTLVGHDINYISVAGALGLTGQKDGPPAIPLNLIADFGAGGMQAAFGIVVALLAREKTGKGQYLDIGLADGVLSLMAELVAGALASGVPLRRGDSLLNGGVPYYNVYQTEDNKYISVGCLEPWFYESLCRALGREDFIPHQNADRKKQEEIFAAFRAIFRTKTRDEWFEYLRTKEVCVGQVYDYEEIFSDPQLQSRQMLVELNHPTEGKVKQVGIPLKFSVTPGSIRRLAPKRGEHTEEVLKELGYTPVQIAQWRQAGVV